MNHPTLHALVGAARTTFEAAGITSARADAATLAAHVLGCEPGELARAMVLGKIADASFVERYGDLVAERARRVPLQHLTGIAHFRRLALRVGPGVFIPRPESELVAGAAIEEAHRRIAEGSATHPVVVDLCTGSGAIALAVKDEAPPASVHAVEISPEAHAWAQANVAGLGLEVDLRLGDALTSFEDLFAAVDIVTANPPYIPSGMVPTDPEVREHDPSIALYGGSADGLALPRLVAARAASLLRPGGLLVIEHADSQGESLPAALAESGSWSSIDDRRDLAGRPRATLARRADTP